MSQHRLSMLSWAQQQTMPPIREDAGEFMVEQAEELLPLVTRELVPTTVESVAAKSLALGS